MEVLRQDLAPVKPPKPPEHATVRISFWNNAGAQSLVCPHHEAAEITRRLIASGAVVWHSEVWGA